MSPAPPPTFLDYAASVSLVVIGAFFLIPSAIALFASFAQIWVIGIREVVELCREIRRK